MMRKTSVPVFDLRDLCHPERFRVEVDPLTQRVEGSPSSTVPKSRGCCCLFKPACASLVSSQHRQPTVTPTYSIDHHAPDFFSRFLQLQGWLRQNNAHVQLCLRPRR